MTFLHKLARRLARLKARTLIAAAAVSAAAGILGCEQPRGSTEPITPTVSQLVVSPKTVTLQPDQLQDFMAVGLTSTGDTAQVDVTWSASGGSVTQKATRGGRHYGQYKTGLCGTYTVTATANPGNKSDNASVAVTCTGTVASVVVSPAAASLAAGGTVQLTATPLDTSGNVMTGSAVSWSSGTPAVATVDGTGLATGVAAGSAAITATSGGKSGTATLTVTTPGGSTTPGAVTNLVVAGTTDNAVTLSFTEVSDGTGQPASYDVRAAVGTISWGDAPSVSGGTCATPLGGTAVGAKRTCTVLGLAAATGYQFQLVAFRGTLNQGAVFGGLSNVATGTTAASTAAVASVTVSPATASVLVGSSVQLTATLKDASGTLLSGRSLTWASLSPAVATVTQSGVVTGLAVGTATITATSEGKTGSAAISVTAAQPGVKIDTIFREGFESGSLSVWDDTCCGPTHTVVTDATFAYSGTHYLKITYPQGSSGGGSLSKFFMPGYTKTYVRYHFRIPGNFQGGTKLIMFRGSRIDNVWSSFGVAGSCPSGTDFFVTNVVTRDLSSLPARFYTYYPGMVREPYNNNICWGRYGDSYDPGGGGSNPASYFPPLDVSRDVWHTLEFEVQLNDPGQANGVQRFWLDGVLRGEWKNFVFRTSTVLMLNALTLESSMNETQGGSPQNQAMYVDDILVTTGRPNQ